MKVRSRHHGQVYLVADPTYNAMKELGRFHLILYRLLVAWQMQGRHFHLEREGQFHFLPILQLLLNLYKYQIRQIP